MGMAIKIRMLLAARQMSIKDLSEKLEPPTTSQNLNGKLRRDNLSEKELAAIAIACDATFEGNFIMNDTGKEI